MTPHGNEAGDAVQRFVDALPLPRRREVAALRAVILGVDPAIGEAIKWNAPSFRTGEHFATMNLRAKDGLLLVLHLGAKKSAAPAPTIADPQGLLKWLGPDRACVTFRDEDAVLAARDALTRIVRQWLAHLPA
jgi:hypothetical protein